MTGAWPVGTPDTVLTNNFREVRVLRNAGEAWGLGSYRVTSVSSKLRCVGTDGGLQQDVSPFELRFELVDSCELEIKAWFDRTGDGELGADDVQAQVVAPVDFNLDGGRDSRDMFLLLLAVTRYGG